MLWASLIYWVNKIIYKVGKINAHPVNLLFTSLRENIYSNKSPGHLTVLLFIRPLFISIFFCKNQTQKPHKHMYRPSWLMDMGIWLSNLWLIILKFDGWALTGVWTAIGYSNNRTASLVDWQLLHHHYMSIRIIH